MADENATAVTSFAEFEAAGGKFNAPPEPAKPAAEPAEKAEPVEAAEESPAAAETESAEEKPAAAAPEKKPAGKSKLSLADEHAKLLKEVTDLRRQRRELQAPAGRSEAPSAEAAPSTAADEKPPVRPKLSTFSGTLEQYEAEVEKYEQEQRAWIEKQWERKQSEQQAKATQQKIAEAYGQKLAEHLKEHPEYDAEIAQTPMSALMVDIVLHEGPALGQALIEDKEQARRIQALPRDIQIFEMGRLAAQLNGAANGRQAPAEPANEAPAPVKVPARLNASGSGSATTLARPDRGAKSFAEWEPREMQIARERLARGRK
jgi:hypothetical protein